jgi:hypothetical protein
MSWASKVSQSGVVQIYGEFNLHGSKRMEWFLRLRCINRPDSWKDNRHVMAMYGNIKQRRWPLCEYLLASAWSHPEVRNYFDISLCCSWSHFLARTTFLDQAFHSDFCVRIVFIAPRSKFAFHRVHFVPNCKLTLSNSSRYIRDSYVFIHLNTKPSYLF